MESFGKRLASIRKENDLTQSDIAEKLHVSSQAVSKWENDITSPDIPTMITLSEIFHMSLDELVGKESTQPKCLPEEERKDKHHTFVKIIIDSAEGDKVRLNLPLEALDKVKDSDRPLVINGSSLEGIDLKNIIELAEQGLVGELISVDTAEGDHVSIVVE